MVGMRGRAASYVSLLALPLLVACSVPVAGNLEDPDANQAVALLERGGIGATKERDPEHENRFRIDVARGEASAAIAALAAENLPPKTAPGVLEALGQGGVVPSRFAERARWASGVAGDLERSLRTLDRVSSVRVHLAIPERDALSPEETSDKATGSVLILHRGALPPIAAADVQRLVSGAVPGLAPEDVSVVMTPSAAANRPVNDLVHFGPVTVTRSSGASARWLVAGTVLFDLLLVGAIVGLWMRLRRTELNLVEARAATEGDARARK